MVTGVQTCALPISHNPRPSSSTRVTPRAACSLPVGPTHPPSLPTELYPHSTTNSAPPTLSRLLHRSASSHSRRVSRLSHAPATSARRRLLQGCRTTRGTDRGAAGLGGGMGEEETAFRAPPSRVGQALHHRIGPLPPFLRPPHLSSLSTDHPVPTLQPPTPLPTLSPIPAPPTSSRNPPPARSPAPRARPSTPALLSLAARVRIWPAS